MGSRSKWAATIGVLATLLVPIAACGEGDDTVVSGNSSAETKPTAPTSDSIPMPTKAPELPTPSVASTDIDQLLSENPYKIDGGLGTVCWVAQELTLMSLRLSLRPEKADVAGFVAQLPTMQRDLGVAVAALGGAEQELGSSLAAQVERLQALAARGGTPDAASLAGELSTLETEATGPPICV